MNPAQQIGQVLIVGDGPAGCAAAITCARLGLHTILVSSGAPRSHFPESVLAGGLDLVRLLGVKNLETVCVGPTFTEVVQRDWVPDDHTAKMEWPARHVRRDYLDSLLLDRALACGISVVCGHARSVKMEDGGIFRVELAKGDITVRAQFIIDATGVAQWLRRQFKLPRQVLSASLVCRRGFARSGSSHGLAPRFYIEKDGWFWVAPTGPKTAVWTHVAAARERMSRSLPDELVIEGKTEQVGRTWTLIEGVGGPNYTLTGDAGGHLDPGSGDGVTLALQSGRNAAITAARILRHPYLHRVAPAAYSEWWHHRMTRKARTMAFFYATHGLSKLMNPSAISNPR